MLTLYSGRPDDGSRLPKEIKCYDLLDTLGVSYQRVDHAPAMTMEICAQIDKSLDALTTAAEEYVRIIQSEISIS